MLLDVVQAWLRWKLRESGRNGKMSEIVEDELCNMRFDTIVTRR